MSEMRDANMPLLDRIEAVQQRIQNGHALRRIPVEATDGDVVLSDCAKELARLRAERDALREFVASMIRCRYPVCPTIDPSGYGWDIPRLNEVIDAAIDAAPSSGLRLRSEGA